VGLMAEHFGEPAAVFVNASLFLLYAIGIWIFVPKFRTQK
jgi:hypothetical protein